MNGESAYIIGPYSVAIAGTDLQLIFSGRQINVRCRAVITGFVPFLFQTLQAISVFDGIGIYIINGCKLKGDITFRRIQFQFFYVIKRYMKLTSLYFESGKYNRRYIRTFFHLFCVDFKYPLIGSENDFLLTG